jgi:chitin synthase
VGNSREFSRPGNRGKRDSQLILMRFLSRVHFQADMSPLELELMNQMKNIIGIPPSEYEVYRWFIHKFLLQIDADTILLPTSLNKLVSTMIHDSKIAGLCGETLIFNEKQSWVVLHI